MCIDLSHLWLKAICSNRIDWGEGNSTQTRSFGLTDSRFFRETIHVSEVGNDVDETRRLFSSLRNLGKSYSNDLEYVCLLTREMVELKTGNKIRFFLVAQTIFDVACGTCSTLRPQRFARFTYPQNRVRGSIRLGALPRAKSRHSQMTLAEDRSFSEPLATSRLARRTMYPKHFKSCRILLKPPSPDTNIMFAGGGCRRVHLKISAFKTSSAAFFSCPEQFMRT